MPFGYIDTQYIDLPALMDESYLQDLSLDSGLAFADAMQAIDERLTAFNGTVDPLIAALVTPTREGFVEYMQARQFKLTPKGEYGLPRPQKGHDVGGHMLPLRDWEVSVGWTEDGLRQMRLEHVQAQIDAMLAGFRAQYMFDVLTRLYSAAEDPVEYGKTTATSPGFAGSGTGLNVYARPYPNGTALPGGYTHYVRSDAAGRSAAIIAAVGKLKAQGHLAPFDLLASASEIAAITADTTNFIGVGSALVRPAPDQAEALVDANQYLGVFANEIRVRPATDRFTDPNIAVFKTYGSLNERNPLAIRFRDQVGLPDNGRSVYIRSRSLYPLGEGIAIGSWGVGVNDRTAAVLISIAASGNYVAPTISL